MKNMRWMGLMAVAGAVTALTGCVAPGPYYGDAYGGDAYGGDFYDGGGYAQPYYNNPTVVAPPLFLGIGADSGPRYYDGRPYYGRPGYYNDARPGYAPRPDYVPRAGYGQRPQWGGRPGFVPGAIGGPQARVPGTPAPVFKPSPGPGAPSAVYQPSWNNKERP